MTVLTVQCGCGWQYLTFNESVADDKGASHYEATGHLATIERETA